jgi:hypothetical protein
MKDHLTGNSKKSINSTYATNSDFQIEPNRQTLPFDTSDFNFCRKTTKYDFVVKF